MVSVGQFCQRVGVAEMCVRERGAGLWILLGLPEVRDFSSTAGLGWGGLVNSGWVKGRRAGYLSRSVDVVQGAVTRPCAPPWESGARTGCTWLRPAGVVTVVLVVGGICCLPCAQWARDIPGPAACGVRCSRLPLWIGSGSRSPAVRRRPPAQQSSSGLLVFFCFVFWVATPTVYRKE